MKLLKVMLIIITIIVLSGLAVSLFGCGSESDEAELSDDQVVTVQRGDLTIEITAVGNLALSRTEDLAFEIAGTVEEVLVEEGDVVEEGQVLAKLDTSEWEDNLAVLEDQVTAEERDLLQAQINLQTAEQNLKNSRDNEAIKELALLNAQISLEQAEYNLSVAEETYTWPEVEVAQADVDQLKAYLQYALDGGFDRLVTRVQAELDAAEAKLNAMLEGYDTEEVAIKKKQVESAEMALAQAQEDLAEVAEDVAIKETQLTLNQAKLEDGQKALEDAEEELEEAKSKSPVITAPFAGFITMVNVEGGDEVLKGTVAVQLADPEKFEADVMVSEMDILQVKLGGEAWVQVDAMQGLSLPAKVTHISPTATIQSGVVNYEVKVEIQSFETIHQERQEARQEAMQDISSGQLPERLRQAIEEGSITQEQAEEMIKQGQQGEGGQLGQIPTMIPEDFQLREGLTVTVSILVDERTDVLLVPNAAITRKGNETHVQVMSPDGSTTERLIQTGISDWQYTEVTDGLSEGEQVVVPETTTTTSTTQRPAGQPSMPFLPGRPH